MRQKQTPEQRAAYKREWAERNKARRNERARMRRLRDEKWRDEQNARRSAWEATNRDKVNGYVRARYHRDADKSREKQRGRYARKPAEQLAKTAAGIKRFRAANEHYTAAHLRLWRSAKARAKAKGLEFTLSPFDVVVPTLCPVFGFPLDLEAGKKLHDRMPSLDRFDNDKGYVPGNVFVISWRANRLKCDATVAELDAVLRYMRR